MDELAAPDNVKRSLSILHLVAISYFLVSAGPFGQEEAIAAGGARLAFIALCVIPVIFAFPLAMMSSEQASWFPACGGAIEWGLILGKPAAYLNCYIRFLRSLFDNALYPVMVCDYMAAVIPGMQQLYVRVLVAVGVNALSLLCNMLGVEAVGFASALLAVVINVPFLLFVVFAVPSMSAERIFATYPSERGSPNFAVVLSTTVWQFSGFDTVAALSAETKNPKRTFPIAMALTVLLVMAGNLLPTIAGVSIEPDLDHWHGGAFASVADLLPQSKGGWLGCWISIAGALSALSLLNVALSCTGREFYACGRIGAMPLAFLYGNMQKNLRGDYIPARAIVIMSVFTLPFTLMSFSALIEWVGLLTVLAQVMQMLMFAACRIPRCRKRYNENCIRIDDGCADDTETFMGVEDDNSGEENRFIICGGWPVALCVLLPIGCVSAVMCYISGWMAILVSTGLVCGMFFLKGVEMMILRSWKHRKVITRSAPEKEELEVINDD